MKAKFSIGVIEFPGTNCERESLEAIRRAGMEPIPFRWNEDHERLAQLDGYLIAGGFSYEDRSRSGIIAALDPIIHYLREENEKGKPILGICNGAQILVETGLVPGLPGYRLGAALADNRRIVNGNIAGTGFYNAWVNITAVNVPESCAFARKEDAGKVMRIPAAHAEGRFIIPSEMLANMHEKGMTVFRYSDSEGKLDPEFPVNPNGSVDNIAGITNAAGNVMALMPHPERTEAGDSIFQAMRSYLEEAKPLPEELVFRGVPPTDREEVPYKSAQGAQEMIVELVISDNEAVSVENALRHRRVNASIIRRTHWEIILDDTLSSADRIEIIKHIEASGELYNPNKELSTKPVFPASSRTILVRDLPEEDTTGEHKRHALTDWFGIEGIAEVRSGTLWTITPDPKEDAAAVCDAAEHTHIFANPYSKKRFLYD